MNTEKMMRSAIEYGMNLEGAPVAYEFYNTTTGHAVVDYTRWTHVGHLREEDGYIARPLAYAGHGANENLLAIIAGLLSIEDSVTQGQERERRDEWVPKARAAIAGKGV